MYLLQAAHGRSGAFGLPAFPRPSPRQPTVPPMIELDLQNVVPALRAGSVIAYPTEAVWGLGCDPANETAVM